MRFSVFQLSRRGARARNEDRMGYAYTRQACLVVLADGMGGHPGGEIAAQIAVRSMLARFEAQANPRLSDAPAFLAAALLQAHGQILHHARTHGLAEAPRTTLVAALLQQGQAHWIHCGDSRLYLARGGVLQARTHDHSHHGMAERAQQPLPKVSRNLLFTCLGAPSEPIFDQAGPWTLAQGDRLLLCSDGLWEPLAEAELLAGLGQGPVSLCVPRLVDAALQRAGASSDNVTAIALEWETPGAPAAPGGISTEASEGDAFRSTLQFDTLAAPEDELSEAAIERKIAEINAAIRRPGERRR
ncbi:PP2C family protein-serine/threonine phosphatase [Comamonas endophytica]|uniref:Serine/threonine-protein phosphatase n=1 Tax=Comamonas endophytica TaxID=2949090 RepID=A0ABY6G8T4_9BURK|nr:MULTISPECIES: PP2C family serine/threonine-protein phosphatase [unclassified Acidovorax]MCD2511376.1 serine/threonine-protein phosphatase [Acidovorax sp. D4N7]UYG50770.1 serine/threonine-protein phosphatase [Acidovorax sp. 5MLIR]